MYPITRVQTHAGTFFPAFFYYFVIFSSGSLGPSHSFSVLPLVEIGCTIIYLMCVVFSSHSFWTSIDVPAGVTQEEGNTGFSIHLLSAVLALIFLAKRIQPFLSLVDREVEFCVLTI